MSEETEVRQPPVVAKEYAGKWIAWDRDHRQRGHLARSAAEGD
jgi:hypothetical protein